VKVAELYVTGEIGGVKAISVHEHLYWAVEWVDHVVWPASIAWYRADDVDGRPILHGYVTPRSAAAPRWRSAT
jgi:hypothetical protein